MVFISYSHDSDEHSEHVLQFANALRGHGIDVELDRYHVRPPKGWPHWCEEQLRPENSDFVLIICTQTYLQRVQDKVSADEGRGVFWEGGIIYDYIYDAKGNTRFVPILLTGGSPDFIPVPIRNHTRYSVQMFDFSDSGYQALYRELTGQPLVTKPPIGKVVEMGRALAETVLPLKVRPVKTDFSASQITFNPSLRPSSDRQPNRRETSTVYGIEFVADGPLTEFDQETWLAALRQLAGKDISKIQITSIRRGSTVVRVVGDPDVIAKVLHQLKNSSESFRDFQAETRFRSYTGVLTNKAVERIFGRNEELARLDQAWAEPKAHVLSIVGSGGVGKSHLIAHWMTLLGADGWRGAERVFDWSFYSQGLREQGTVSGDAFITAALVFFGDPSLARSAASPWDKGSHLAQLVAQQRTLLVLDGLEPLQHPPGPLMGELRDPAVAALLRGLAKDNSGLCIVTTRVGVTDLAPFLNTTVLQWDLENLTMLAGLELLKSMGVRGTEGELHRAVQQVSGHAFTLYLLGRYLVSAHEGDIKRRDKINFVKRSKNFPAANAFGTLNAYEQWLSTSPEGSRQLAVLRLLGLFDRPADFGCLAALRKKPAISGLTEPLAGLNKTDWERLLAQLADLGLVSIKSAHSTLDAHPIIREYFGAELQKQMPKAWRAAHRRVYEYLKKSTKDKSQPTLDDLQSLYQAVAHGCLAGLQHDACDLYQKRILRGNERFSWKRLGAFGADLGAISCFFERPYTRISREMTEAEGAFLLDEAALGLRALGRLTEARDPIRGAIKMAVNQSAWANAARGAGNLSELELTLGAVMSSAAEATKSVRLSDRSSNLFMRSVMRTVLADAQHQAGQRDSSEALFQQAERMQAELQPEFPLLYSVRGFRYGDLLLSAAERSSWRAVMVFKRGRPLKAAMKNSDVTAGLENCRNVSERAARTLTWTQENNLALLDVALDKLTLGRVALYSWILSGSLLGSEGYSESYVEAAVVDLRGAGSQDHIPRGLLTRAWMRFLNGASTGSESSQEDLDEAWEIAERGRMRLHMADIHLYRARLFHGVKPYPWDKNPDGSGRGPTDDLRDARKLIEQCGYWRRKEELEDAEEAAKNW